MKKLFLSITALIMVFVSVFGLAGCVSSSTSKEKITKIEYMQAYTNTAKELLSAFSRDDNHDVIVCGEFAYTLNTSYNRENYKEVEYKETIDGELITENILYSKSNDKTRTEIFVKEVDGTVFFKLVKEEINNYKYVNVAENYMLENCINNVNNKEEWHLGKNENGYYVAVKKENVENFEGEITENKESVYKYYDTEEEFNGVLLHVVSLVYDSLDELLYHGDERHAVEFYYKNGNKYEFKGFDSTLQIEDEYRYNYNYLYKDTVQEMKSIQKINEFRTIDDGENGLYIDDVTFKKEVGNLKLDSFDGYIEDSTIDVYNDLDW
jgi:hypothetical protein